ncbi:MAG: cation-efflux pump [Bacteroidetes bacterium]|nr:cation-efflux pump [Bacteroidota bacterium]
MEETSKIKVKVALNSLFAAVFITGIKILAAYFSGSLAILTEVVNSGIDIFVCLVTIFSVKYAAKPADDDHNYGHEKAENISALIQVLFLFGTSSFIIYEAVQRIFLGKHPELNITAWTFAALLLSIGIDFFRARALNRIADETKSNALKADALHFSSDILSSMIVIVGLIFSFFGYDKADAISAFVVAIIIIILGLKMSKKAIDSLLDRVPPGLSEKIRYETLLIEGVEGIKNFRIRSTGPKIFIDMVITISRIIPFSKAHDIMDAVERRLNQLIDNADIVIHSEPVETDKETINDKIKMIVNGYGLKCHDIFSHKIGNEIFSELHVEVTDTNDLIKAHDRITELEEKIKSEIGIISNVKIHIDEPSNILYDTTDITGKSEDMIIEIKKIISLNNDVTSSGDYNVIITNGKIRVSLNCTFDYHYSLDEVHDIVTLLESKILAELKSRYPKLSNVIIHAEPNTINN